MSRRVARLFRRGPSDGRYNLSREGAVLQVKLLDDTAAEFAVGSHDTGDTVLEKVGKLVSLSETLFFGLKLRTAKAYYRWLDRERPVLEQLGKYADRSYSDTLYLAVQYFVHDVALLPDENTRYHYYLQLKKLILSRRLLCSLDQAIILASYALQAEFGDHDREVHTVDFLSDFELIPSDTLTEMDQHLVMRKLAELHEKNCGISPGRAESCYIKQAQLLPTYGIEFFPSKDSNNLGLLLGASYVGIVVRHANGLPPVSFRWVDILNIRPKSKHGGGQLQIETPSEYIFFKMDDSDMAQYVWHFFELQRTFFKRVAGLTSPLGSGKKAQPQEFSLDAPLSGKYENGASTRPGIRRKLTISRIHGRNETDNGAGSTFNPANEDDLDDVQRDTPMDISHLHSPNGPRTLASNQARQLTSKPSSPSSSQVHQLTAKTSSPSSQSPESGDHGNPSPVKHVSTGGQEYAVVSREQRSRHGDHNKSNGFARTPSASSSFEEPPPLTRRQESSGTSSSGRDLPSTKGRPSPLQLSTQAESTNVASDDDERRQRFAENSTKRFSAAAVTSHGLWNQVLSGSSENLVERTDASSTRSTGSSRLDRPLLSPTSPRSEQSRMLRECITEGNIYQEFDDVPKKNEEASWNDSKRPENLPRNRFRDISPYDYNRVLLSKEHNADRSDYINASHVQVDIGHRHLHYIAAQAPLKPTVPDFWQMIWEQDVSIIAMVTPRFEGKREKSAAYWPEGTSAQPEEQYGNAFQVRVLSSDEQDRFVTRRLQLLNLVEKKHRTVSHLQFLGWPDHGIPDNPRDFLDYLGAVRLLRRSSTISAGKGGGGGSFEPPVLLHCSAGIGRTGVTILLDILITAFEENEPIAIPSMLENIRDQRAHFVQNAGQYKMVYQTLIEYLDSNRLI